ncbi:hypothetical protein B9479_007440 [Cryptococcus floricola]|uniref:Uncharacterized protein n=1 Tax=Cryptococcus floricola TaxID=2591691 RepID=A0A5D3AM10_9TREE|nr:hypothetical protein B9479_007440 [Cryptococcus floricola]
MSSDERQTSPAPSSLNDAHQTVSDTWPWIRTFVEENQSFFNGSAAPSSLNDAHQTVPDESSLIATGVEEIVSDFEFDLDANIEGHEVLGYYEHVFDSARQSILTAVRDMVTMALKDEVASRKREGRTGVSMDDVIVDPQSVRLDEDWVIHFKELSVYGEGLSGKKTSTNLRIDSGLRPEGDWQEGDEERALLPYEFEWVSPFE